MHDIPHFLDKINPIFDLKTAEEYQDFKVSKEDKAAFGIIYTPFSLIQNMFSLLPDTVFENPNNTWLDMGAGTGYFSIYLYHRLFISLQNQIPNPAKRKKHIIKNMIYMAEIKESHIIHLKHIFGKDANIISNDFLSLNENEKNEKMKQNNFNIIIGNPPYNCSGQIKTPTNTHMEKTQDGKTVWPDFIKKTVELLVPNGYLLAITPAIWLKPDKAGIYKLLVGANPYSKFKLLKLYALSTSETNKIFNYQAQTPTTCFLAQKKNDNESAKSNGSCQIYDKSLQQYIEYPICGEKNIPIPFSSISIIKKLLETIDRVGHIQVYKTNMPSAKSIFSISPKPDYPYKNVKTCIFSSRKSTSGVSSPEIIYEYSNIRQAYSTPNKPKLIFAHKMFGFPFLDKSGDLGISYRDNYVITDKSLQELQTLQKFFSTKLVLAIYDATRYRMRYLEKYAFELIPDITKLNDFPTDITDNTIADYFDFSQQDREIIKEFPEYIIDTF